MKKQLLWLVVVALLVLTLGCLGSDDETPEPTIVTQPTATEPSSSGGQVRFTIENQSDEDIWYVYISPVEDDYWGNDLLGSEILWAGESHDFYLTPGAYDLRVDDSDQNALQTEWNLNIRSDQTWVFSGSDSGGGGGGEYRFTIQNQSNEDIWYVYISPSENTTWGSDWLGADILWAGESYDFYVDAGSYDLRLADSSSSELQEEYGINITGDYIWTFTGNGGGGGGGGDEVRFTIQNNSDEDIWYVYLSPSEDTTWGPDQLGSSILWAGDSHDFYVTPGTYDLRLDSTGNETLYTEFGININADQVWPYTGSDSGGGGGGGSEGDIRFTIVNRSGQDIWYVYISPVESDYWGSDWLGTDILPNGQSYDFYVSAGNYDLRVDDSDQNIITTEWGFVINADTTWTVDN